MEPTIIGVALGAAVLAGLTFVGSWLTLPVMTGLAYMQMKDVQAARSDPQTQ